MDKEHDSFLELAVEIVTNKNKPQTMESIEEEVFALKGEKPSDMQLAQFQVDFMLSGYFVCCGEDRSGKLLWDLKGRQESALLDKDGSNIYVEEDSEVLSNELSEDLEFGDEDINIDKYIEDDEEDATAQDDIEEELTTLDGDQDRINMDTIEIDDDDEEKQEEEQDEIEDELEKRGHDVSRE